MPHLRSLAFFAVLGSFAVAGAQAPDANVVAQIREEGLNHSQVGQTLSYLSDVIGPRLTASPSMKRANEWTRDTMTGWGLKNAHLEAWGPFGRGWQLERFSAQVSSPLNFPLIAYPKAWSPGLRGPVTTDVVLVDVADVAGLDAFKGKLKGKIVLSGGAVPMLPQYGEQGKRYTDAELAEMTQSQPPRSAPAGVARRPGAAGRPDSRATALARARLRFFMNEGVVAVIDGARGEDGTIFVQSAAVPPPVMAPTMPPVAATTTTTTATTTAAGTGTRPAPPRIQVWDKSAPKTVPQVSVSGEQYNRMVRMIQQGVALKMSLDLKVSFFDKDLMGYNTAAEIPGTDLADQIVMVGGHMDSWQAGTGATDNGAGVAVAMEAVRILQTLHLPMRRTVRVALWSGEEEGLFGSRAYVAQHFGSYPPPANGVVSFSGAPVANPGTLTRLPEYEKISAYFNLDNGSGKIRGVYQQGNEAVGPIFSEWLTPFKDLGASTVTIRNTGSTDHVSFDAIGIPGFQFIQDPLDYGTRTHHSNQDVFDRAQIDDLKQAAVIMATFLYNTAMRDDRLPRKPLAAGS